MLTRNLLTVSLAAGLAAGASTIAAAQIVQVDGSSTVYPITEAFAEEFQKSTGMRVTVGVSGTGGGFKKFCRGETDISGASRPISNSEKEACADNGIEFIEMPIAVDALAVIINPDNDWAACMTVDQLKTMWEPAAQEKVTRWSQIDSNWPDEEIGLYGAGTDSGTYDYFTFAIVGKEHSSRGDYTATEDDNITIQGVIGNPYAIGFLGLAYVTENEGAVKAVAIEQENGECVGPSVETAGDASYQPLTRPIFWYISKASADDKEHVRDFVEFGFDADNQQALVGEVGYVPLPAEAANNALAKFEARSTGSAFDGGSKLGVTINDLVGAAATN